MEHHQTEQIEVTSRSDARVRGFLTVTATVLAVLIVVLGGRGMVEPARADVATNGTITAVNLGSGPGNDVIALLDVREERLFIYQVVNLRDLTLTSSEDLRDLFTRARAAASGSR